MPHFTGWVLDTQISKNVLLSTCDLRDVLTRFYSLETVSSYSHILKKETLYQLLQSYSQKKKKSYVSSCSHNLKEETPCQLLQAHSHKINFVSSCSHILKKGTLCQLLQPYSHKNCYVSSCSHILIKETLCQFLQPYSHKRNVMRAFLFCSYVIIEIHLTQNSTSCSQYAVL
jgi:hypothetical protein